MNLEALAWRLLAHDAAAARRDGHELPAEAQALLDWFERRGVVVLDADGDGVAPRRIHPRQTLAAGLLYGPDPTGGAA